MSRSSCVFRDGGPGVTVALLSACSSSRISGSGRDWLAGLPEGVVAECCAGGRAGGDEFKQGVLGGVPVDGVVAFDEEGGDFLSREAVGEARSEGAPPRKRLSVTRLAVRPKGVGSGDRGLVAEG